ncbi:hypothetical protein [Entomohabitans teleogrylli]|uniref:hypothetical protein n=1 Tax=Entomohabitans teleogrylli TaxID=1384589 RepID=UPI00073D1C7F|nr:hypothetical protein [Entomohabitans teleogrylli]
MWVALVCTALARPALETVGPTLAGSGSGYYDFIRYQVSSEDGARLCRIWLALSARPGFSGGWTETRWRRPCQNH